MPHAQHLAFAETVKSLPIRSSPYWNILEYCRHIGIYKPRLWETYWVARVRLMSGNYRQTRLGVADFSNVNGFNYEQAVLRARRWFETREISQAAAPAFPVGSNQELRYQKASAGFTVGDALLDYVEWKRIAAAKTHFETNLSLINHHIISRLSHIQLSELTARHITQFSRDILETPPKRGNQSQGKRRRLQDLDPEALRKRKKTLNALIGILRLALRMAWENGETDNERAWRCIRSVPNFEKPRNIILTRPECRHLLERCRSDLQELVQAALYTGCRARELVDLKVADVACGIYGIYVAPSKSRQSRYVILPDEGMAFILGLCEGRTQGENVFKMNSGRLWASNYKHLFKAAVVAAELPSNFVFHGLRHTYASQLVQAGTPLIVVAKQLGHASIDTVSRTYGHLHPGTQETEIRTRFSALSYSAIAHANKIEQEFENIRLSLQDAAPRDGQYVERHQHHWPRSNFSLYSGDLLRSFRAR